MKKWTPIWADRLTAKTNGKKLELWLLRQPNTSTGKRYLLGSNGRGSIGFEVQEWHKSFPELRLKPGEEILIEADIGEPKSKPKLSLETMLRRLGAFWALTWHMGRWEVISTAELKRHADFEGNTPRQALKKALKSEGKLSSNERKGRT